MTTPLMDEIVRTLDERQPLQSLAPTQPWNADLEERIEQASGEELVGSNDVEAQNLLALKAGLLLWNDSLFASHRCSQQVETSTGSYWHGIMHRMEPDYSNAKYWFHKTGFHPAYEPLQRSLAEFAAERQQAGEGVVIQRLMSLAAGDKWDADAFVDLVEQALTSGSAEEIRELERIQKIEIKWLLDYTYQSCAGGKLFDTV